MINMDTMFILYLYVKLALVQFLLSFIPKMFYRVKAGKLFHAKLPHPGDQTLIRVFMAAGFVHWCAAMLEQDGASLDCFPHWKHKTILGSSTEALEIPFSGTKGSRPSPENSLPPQSPPHQPLLGLKQSYKHRSV